MDKKAAIQFTAEGFANFCFHNKSIRELVQKELGITGGQNDFFAVSGLPFSMPSIEGGLFIREVRFIVNPEIDKTDSEAIRRIEGAYFDKGIMGKFQMRWKQPVGYGSELIEMFGTYTCYDIHSYEKLLRLTNG